MKLTGARVPAALTVLGVALVALSGWAAMGSADPAPRDAYLWFAGREPVTSSDTVAILGDDTVPSVKYGERWERNPLVVAQWGLDGYSNGRPGDLLAAANWLVDHQAADGTWRYDFEFYVYSADATLRPGWASALAQGTALSVFARAYEATEDPVYVEAGRAALEPLSVPVAHGGLERTWRGHEWFEEYPTSEPSLVINGMMFTLVGLDEWADATGDPVARSLYARGEESLSSLIGLADLGGGASAYALAFRDRDLPSSPVTGTHYAQIHVDLAAEMQERTGRAVYGRLAERWSAVLPMSRTETLARLAVAVLLLGALVALVRRLRRI